jgi:hypothetical protein
MKKTIKLFYLRTKMLDISHDVLEVLAIKVFDAFLTKFVETGEPRGISAVMGLYHINSSMRRELNSLITASDLISLLEGINKLQKKTGVANIIKVSLVLDAIERLPDHSVSFLLRIPILSSLISNIHIVRKAIHAGIFLEEYDVNTVSSALSYRDYTVKGYPLLKRIFRNDFDKLLNNVLTKSATSVLREMYADFTDFKISFCFLSGIDDLDLVRRIIRDKRYSIELSEENRINFVGIMQESDLECFKLIIMELSPKIGMDYIGSAVNTVMEFRQFSKAEFAFAHVKGLIYWIMIKNYTLIGSSSCESEIYQFLWSQEKKYRGTACPKCCTVKGITDFSDVKYDISHDFMMLFDISLFCAPCTISLGNY